jgi:hypothetical protein
MNDYILLMHDDAPAGGHGRGGAASWEQYLGKLRAAGRFGGGSSIGAGACASKAGPPKAITSQLSGYIRIQAASLDDALTLVAGNPVYEAGGTVEVRELPRD